MKFFLVIFAVIVAVKAETVTEGLLEAQEDLAIGHRFFQELISDSRATLSGFIENDVRQLLDSHMEAYSSIQTKALETSAAIDELEVNESSEDCLFAIRNRWQIQISRYGQRLSECISTPYRRFSAWNNFLLDIHTRSQLTSNQVQNSGVAVLSETNRFDGPEDFPDLINGRFQDITFRIIPYERDYQEFFEDIEQNTDDAIARLIQCDRYLVEDFEYEAREDLDRARRCVIVS